MKICNSSDFQIWQQVNMIIPPPTMIQKYSIFFLSPFSIHRCQLIVLSVLHEPTPQRQPLAPIYMRMELWSALRLL